MLDFTIAEAVLDLVYDPRPKEQNVYLENSLALLLGREKLEVGLHAVTALAAAAAWCG